MSEQGPLGHKQVRKADVVGANIISESMRQLLEEEIIESEIEAAMDAAAEENIHIVREEAIRVLLRKEKD